MSVYTRIDRAGLEHFVAEYNVGTLVGYEGILAGIENTNYFVTTTQGQFVLTLFEGLQASELPYFLELMAFLAERGIPSAHPIADQQGHYLRVLRDKPAALVKRLSGASVERPTALQCASLGAALANMHRESQAFPLHRNADRGPLWWRATQKKLTPLLPADEARLLESEINFQFSSRFKNLPKGVIHADLFRDNALFNSSELTGIIDFYYACNDVLLYDVAVTLNDWCSREDGSLDSGLALAMLTAYRERRAFVAVEREAWPGMLRAAALRFWLSRLHDQYFPRAGELTHSKDPNVFKRILLHRIEHEAEIRSLWLS